MSEAVTVLLNDDWKTVGVVDNRPTKVLIVARPGRFTQGLRALLADSAQIEVVGQVDDGPELIEIVARTRPLLVLLDVHLSKVPYLRVLKQLRARYPQVRRLVLIDSYCQREEAYNAGADGVILKGFIMPDLLRAIRTLVT